MPTRAEIQADWEAEHAKPFRQPTREQQHTIRELMGSAWRQTIMPPDDEGYVCVKMTGQWSSSGWYWIAPDGTATQGKP